ncbi:PBSX family phage terminase large subunit, partial [Klebsiella pneumoniae]
IKPTKKGKGSIVQGLQFLMQFDIVIDERCFKTLEEFDNYTWKKDKDREEYINEPVDTYNHCIDSLRYSVERFYRPESKQKTPLKKSINTIKAMGL